MSRVNLFCDSIDSRPINFYMGNCDAENCLERDYNSKDIITCKGSCRKCFHPICVGLSRITSRVLSDINRHFHFFCSDCDMLPAPALADKIGASYDATIGLASTVKCVKHTLESFCIRGSSYHNILSQGIDDLNSYIEKVNSNVYSQSSRFDSLENKIDKLLSSYDRFESCIKTIDNLNDNVISIARLTAKLSSDIVNIPLMITTLSESASNNIDELKAGFTQVTKSNDTLSASLNDRHPIDFRQVEATLSELKSSQSVTNQTLFQISDGLPNFEHNVSLITGNTTDINSTPLISLQAEIANTGEVFAPLIFDANARTSDASKVVKRRASKKKKPKKSSEPNEVGDPAIPIRKSKKSSEPNAVVDPAISIRKSEKSSFSTSNENEPLNIESSNVGVSPPLIIAKSNVQSRRPGPSQPLQTVPKLMAIFVTELLPETTSEDIIFHIVNHCNINAIRNGITCRKLTSKRCSSFKLSVPNHLFSELVSPSNWPVGTFVKEFIYRQSPPKHITTLHTPKNLHVYPSTIRT